MKSFLNAKFPKDVFIVINSATNFVVYMALSEKIRNDSKKVLGQCFGCPVKAAETETLELEP